MVNKPDYGICLLPVGALGVGRGATGRLLTFWLLFVRVFEFRSSVLFESLRGVTLVLGAAALAFGRLTVAGRLALPFALTLVFAFALALVLSFSFLFFGFLGLFSLALEGVLALLFEFVSSTGLTVSVSSPAFATRLISMATV
jgi:hypothetical protein